MKDLKQKSIVVLIGVVLIFGSVFLYKKGCFRDRSILKADSVKVVDHGMLMDINPVKIDLREISLIYDGDTVESIDQNNIYFKGGRIMTIDSISVLFIN